LLQKDFADPSEQRLIQDQVPVRNVDSNTHSSGLDYCVVFALRLRRTFATISAISGLSRLGHLDLFDHLVGAEQERLGDGKTKRLRRGQIDDEIEFARLLNRNVCGLRPAQNFVDDRQHISGERPDGDLDPLDLKFDADRVGKPANVFLLCEPRSCMSSEHFGQLAWQFKRVSGSSGLKVQAAIAC
jgi:hypothetical protein